MDAHTLLYAENRRQGRKVGGARVLANSFGHWYMGEEDMSVRGLVIVAVGYFAVVVYLFWLVIR